MSRLIGYSALLAAATLANHRNRYRLVSATV